MTALAEMLSAVEGATPEQVKALLVAGHAQLWLGKQSCVLTQVLETPAERIFHVWSAGGELNEILALLPGGEAWARGMGCTVMSVNTRRGSSRPLRKRGFEAVYGELRKRL